MPNQPHVLVIDPSQAILDALSLLLADEGYAVSTARTLADPFALRAARPDVVICEPVLPQRPTDLGLGALARLRATLGAVPLILCTAASSLVEPVRACLEAQGMRIVYKPFDIETLLQAIAESMCAAPVTANGPVLIEC